VVLGLPCDQWQVDEHAGGVFVPAFGVAKDALETCGIFVRKGVLGQAEMIVATIVFASVRFVGGSPVIGGKEVEVFWLGKVFGFEPSGSGEVEVEGVFFSLNTSIPVGKCFGVGLASGVEVGWPRGMSDWSVTHVYGEC